MFIPTMKSTYAAAAVITFMNAWNSYLWPKVIMTDNKAMTMPMLIANLITGYVTDYGMLMCGVLFCSIPTMVVFFVCTETVCRRYYRSSQIKNLETETPGRLRKVIFAGVFAVYK